MKKTGESPQKLPGTFTLQVLDVQSLEAQTPHKAVRTYEIARKPKIYRCDLLVAGGGTGGIAAALAACKLGLNVCLTEETSCLGGQMTSQGVSALDENPWVETTGATLTYKRLRDSIRNHYRSLGAVDGGGRFSPFLDPGNCWVSRISFEPRIGAAKISELIEPFVSSGKLRLFNRCRVVDMKIQKGKARSATVADLDSGDFFQVRFRFCLDATELGDLLPLAGVPYSTGAEPRSETGEEHASEEADPENVQDFTYPFVVEFCPGENHTIDKPPYYEEFKQRGKFSFLGYRMFENGVRRLDDGQEIETLPFWEYRRLISRENFSPDIFPTDIAMINWESNDLRGENIIDKPPDTAGARLALGKFLSLGFLYWLQTEAPRDDGGFGYSELKLRPDVLGTGDGLSKFPYIRESRRIKAVRRVLEQDIVASCNPGARARLFSDSVGIGHYPVDIHGRHDVPGVGQSTRPFQIPLSALVQDSISNLVPACKNIGTTHITNGAYRLHPIEWATGEAAGVLAAACRKERTSPLRLLHNRRSLRRLQITLLKLGAPLFWFDDVPPEHPQFLPIEYVSVCHLMKAEAHNLQFRPHAAVTRGEAALAVARLLRIDSRPGKTSPCIDADGDQKAAIERCLGEDLFEAMEERFRPYEALSPEELVRLNRHRLIRLRTPVPDSPEVSRADFAAWLYRLATASKFFARH